MKKVLNNTKKTKEYLDSLPKVYIAACWAGFGVAGFPFSGKYADKKKTRIFSVSLLPSRRIKLWARTMPSIFRAMNSILKAQKKCLRDSGTVPKRLKTPF